MKNKDFKKIYLFISILLFNWFLTAQIVDKTGMPYTLEQLIQLAVRSNLQIKIAELDKEIVIEDYRDTRALDNPGFEYSRGRGETAESPGKPGLWGFDLKWSMPNPIHRYFFLESMKTNITEAEIQAEISKREMVKDLETHYYKLRLYNKLRSLSRERLRVLNEISGISRAKADIGEAKEIDALRAAVEVQKCNTELFRIEKTIASGKNRLNEFLDFTLPEDFTTADDFDFSPLPNNESRILQSIETSPFIRLEFNRVKGEKAQVKAARFSLVESVELSAERAKEIDGKIWKVGIGIAIPLFNWKSALVRRAELQRQKAQIQYEQAKKHLLADIRQLAAEIRVLEKEIETFSDAILKEGRENMDLCEKLYKEGEVPLVVFLDSQESYFEMEERYYEAITEWNILSAELEALLGGK